MLAESIASSTQVLSVSMTSSSDAISSTSASPVITTVESLSSGVAPTPSCSFTAVEDSTAVVASEASTESTDLTTQILLESVATSAKHSTVFRMFETTTSPVPVRHM